MKTYQKLLLILGGTAVVLSGLTILFFSTPGQSWYLPQCTFFRLTGLHCPGCGTTRSLHAFLHGNFLAAFRYNVLLYLLLTVALLLCIKPRLTLKPCFAWTILITVILFFVLRNIPYYPFTLLAPSVQ